MNIYNLNSIKKEHFVDISKDEALRLSKLSGTKLTEEHEKVMKDILNTIMLINIKDLNKIISNHDGCPINLEEFVLFIKNTMGELIMRAIIPPPIYYFIKYKTGGEGIFVIVYAKLDRILTKYKEKLIQIKKIYSKNINDFIEKTILDEVNNFYNNIETKINNILDFKNYIKNIENKIKNELNNFKNKINDEQNILKQKLSNLFEPLKKLTNEINLFLKNIKNLFKEYIIKKISNFFKPIKPLYDFIINNWSYIFTIISGLIILFSLFPHIMQIYNKFTSN